MQLTEPAIASLSYYPTCDGTQTVKYHHFHHIYHHHRHYIQSVERTTV